VKSTPTCEGKNLTKKKGGVVGWLFFGVKTKWGSTTTNRKKSGSRSTLPRMPRDAVGKKRKGMGGKKEKKGPSKRTQPAMALGALEH